MDTFLFAMEAVMPIILVIVLGYVLKRTNVIDDGFLKVASKLVFNIFLPVLLFYNLYQIDSIAGIDWYFLGVALIGLIAMFGIGLLVAILFIPNVKQKGTVVQGIFRTNFAVLGLPLATALFGTEGAVLASLLVLITPLLNIFSVLAFSLFNKDQIKVITVRGAFLTTSKTHST